jgi:Rrf2 family protein
MRELTAATALGLHALHLMVQKSKPVSLNEIRRSGGFAISDVRRVLRRLTDAGLAESRPSRGYVLARASGEITLLDAVQAIEKTKAPTSPCRGDYDACDSRAACILAPICRASDLGVQEALRSFTIAQLRELPVDLPNCLDPRLKPRLKSARRGKLEAS